MVTDCKWYGELLLRTVGRLSAGGTRHFTTVTPQPALPVVANSGQLLLLDGLPGRAEGYRVAASSYFDRLKGREAHGGNVTHRYSLCLQRLDGKAREACGGSDGGLTMNCEKSTQDKPQRKRKNSRHSADKEIETVRKTAGKKAKEKK